MIKIKFDMYLLFYVCIYISMVCLPADVGTNVTGREHSSGGRVDNSRPPKFNLTAEHVGTFGMIAIQNAKDSAERNRRERGNATPLQSFWTGKNKLAWVMNPKQLAIHQNRRSLVVKSTILSSQEFHEEKHNEYWVEREAREKRKADEKRGYSGVGETQHSMLPPTILPREVIYQQEKTSKRSSEAPKGYHVWNENQALPTCPILSMLNFSIPDISEFDTSPYVVEQRKVSECRTRERKDMLVSKVNKAIDSLSPYLIGDDKRLGRALIRLQSHVEEVEVNDEMLIGNFEKFRERVLEITDKHLSKQDTVMLAARSAADYVWPDDIDEDSKFISNDGGTLDGILGLCKDTNQTHSMSPIRIAMFFGNDPKYPLLDDLVSNGVEIPVEPTFVRRNIPQPTRESQRLLGRQAAKYYGDQRNKHRGIIIDPRVLTKESFELLNYINFHWGSEYDEEGKPKVAGRMLSDATHVEGEGVHPVNSEYQKQAGFDKYCPDGYFQPMAVDLVVALYELAKERQVSVRSMWIKKDDVVNAFCNINWEKKSAMLQCIRISNTKIWITSCCSFGVQVSVPAWDFVAGFPQRKINFLFVNKKGERIGVCMRIVDDFISFLLNDWQEYGTQVTHVTMREMWFEFGWSEKKNVGPTKVAILAGMGVDLARERAFLPAKHFNKLCAALFSFDITIGHPLKSYQKIASLTNRASQVVPNMKCFNEGFNEMLRKWFVNGKSANYTTKLDPKERVMYKTPNSAFKTSITVWRIKLFWMYLDPIKTEVPLMSVLPIEFRHGNVEEDVFNAWTDAGTNRVDQDLSKGYENRVGAIIHVLSRNEDGSPCKHDWCCTSVETKWPFVPGDDCLQNLREYQGPVIAMRLAQVADNFNDTGNKALHPGTVWQWTGDNRSALSWMDKNQAKSRGGQLSNLASSLMNDHFQIQWLPAIWKKSEEMGLADKLSRYDPGAKDSETRVKFLAVLSEEQKMLFLKMRYVDLSQDMFINDLLILCKPDMVNTREMQLLDSVKAVVAVIDLVSTLPTIIPRENSSPLNREEVQDDDSDGDDVEEIFLE